MSAEDTKRALEMLEALCGELPRGLSNKDLAAALRCAPSYITRASKPLLQSGWIEKDEATGRFRITSTFSRLTFRVLAAFERSERALADSKRNYTLND